MRAWHVNTANACRARPIRKTVHIKAVANTNIGDHLVTAFCRSDQGFQNIEIFSCRQFHQAAVTLNGNDGSSARLDQLNIVGDLGIGVMGLMQ